MISTHIYTYLLIYLPFRGATASATTASVRRDTFTVKATATEEDMVSWNESWKRTFAKFYNHEEAFSANVKLETSRRFVSSSRIK